MYIKTYYGGNVEPTGSIKLSKSHLKGSDQKEMSLYSWAVFLYGEYIMKTDVWAALMEGCSWEFVVGQNVAQKMFNKLLSGSPSC